MSTVSFREKFGKNVRQARLDRGLSQEGLAGAANLHRTHISLIERGLRSARVETIERLALALRMQPAKLMPTIKWSSRK